MFVFALRAPDPAAPVVDILVRPEVPFEEAWGRRVQKAVGELNVCMASVDDLIRLKSETGRMRDRSDIEALERARRLGLTNGKE